jgi:RNA polymerase sigma factor (sigma-70 family)
MTPSPAPVPELALPVVLRALAGDTPALTRLYATYHPLVLRSAQRTLERLHLSDPPCELASEVWVRLLERECRALRCYDPARGSFRGFMKMVAGQQAYQVARRWQRRAFHEDPRPWGEPTEPLTPCTTTALHHRLLLHRLLAALPRLCSIDLALLEEALFWQTPVPELAPRLGRSVHTLHKRKERLRERLRLAARQLEPVPVFLAA